MDAIIGVVGTILGAFLGWFLTYLSQRGKLNVFISRWDDRFDYDAGPISDENATEKTHSYSYTLSVDVYNSSAETRIMRDIRVVFMRDKQELYTFVPNYKKEQLKAEFANITHNHSIGVVNFPPKSVASFNFFNSMINNRGATDCFWETNKIVLTYRNEKNKLVTIPIKKEDYREYRKNHCLEDIDNG